MTNMLKFAFHNLLSLPQHDQARRLLGHLLYYSGDITSFSPHRVLGKVSYDSLAEVKDLCRLAVAPDGESVLSYRFNHNNEVIILVNAGEFGKTDWLEEELYIADCLVERDDDTPATIQDSWTSGPYYGN